MFYQTMFFNRHIANAKQPRGSAATAQPGQLTDEIVRLARAAMDDTPMLANDSIPFVTRGKKWFFDGEEYDDFLDAKAAQENYAVRLAIEYALSVMRVSS